MRRSKQRDLFRRPAHSVSPGFTVIELLVAIGVVALLMAMILPAIQSSREAARRTVCSDRLRQIGIAVQSHEAQHQRYPTAFQELAWEYEILPFMDQTPLFEKLKTRASDIFALTEFLNGMQLPMFQCPSDATLQTWSVNYLINIGSTFDYLDRYDGFRCTRFLSSRDVPDGLSQTAFASEGITLLCDRKDRRSSWKTPVPYPYEDELDLFADLCAEMPSGAIGVGGDPSRNLRSSANLVYDHIMTPNQPSCLNFNFDLPHSTYASSSDHRAGVNVLFADGAVKFVGNGVARNVWRAVGTRNGHEPVSFP